MMSARAFALVAWMLVSMSVVPTAAMAGDTPLGMRVYSGMNVIKTEGEFSGLQVAIVPYSRGLKALWRSGNGRLDPPLLLDVVKEGRTMKVVVPDDNDMFGEWILTPDGNVLHARGPRDLHFDLKEIPFK
jgi:hypothetical protein